MVPSPTPITQHEFYSRNGEQGCSKISSKGMFPSSRIRNMYGCCVLFILIIYMSNGNYYARTRFPIYSRPKNKKKEKEMEHKLVNK